MSSRTPDIDVEDRIDPEEAMRLDASTLDKTKVYRFIHPRPANVVRRIAQGYEYVLRSETGVRLLNEPEDFVSADDKIWNGDTVLMMVDRSRYVRRRKEVQERTMGRLGATEPAFRERARKSGFRSLTGEEGE